MGSLIDDLVAPEFEVLRVTRHEEAARKWRSSLVPATSSSLPATPPTHQLSESKPVTSAATGHGKGLDSAERDYQKHNKLEDVIAEQLDTLEKLAKEKAQVMVELESASKCIRQRERENATLAYQVKLLLEKVKASGV